MGVLVNAIAFTKEKFPNTTVGVGNENWYESCYDKQRTNTLHYGTSESLKCTSYLLTTFSYRLNYTTKGDESNAIPGGIRTLASTYFAP